MKTCGVSWIAAMLGGAVLTASGPSAIAGGGPLGIDHRIGFDDSGIWARRDQQALEVGVIAVELGGALWLGADDPFGRTLWQTVDASVASSITAQVAKYAFGRERPGQTDNPNEWFKGSCCQSFPSGEVTLQASFVTPIIVNYHAEHPWVWALEVLPLYDGDRPDEGARPLADRRAGRLGHRQRLSAITRPPAPSRSSFRSCRRASPRVSVPSSDANAAPDRSARSPPSCS